MSCFSFYPTKNLGALGEAGCITTNNIEFYEKLNKLSGQALHAKTLAFVHPSSKKLISFNSNLPSGFKKILDLLENLSG